MTGQHTFLLLPFWTMRLLLLALALLLPAAAQAQLNGFYTIGGSSPDYTTISAAVADLNALGVSGPTRFAIRAGTYTEQISIDAITGTSAADTVQFRAANPNNRPTIRFDATSSDNYVWRIVNSDHVKLRNLNFVETGSDANARILVIEGGTDDLSVNGCTFTGLAGATAETGSLVWDDDDPHDRLSFIGNTFTYGYRGLDLRPASSPGTDVLVSNNVFADQHVEGIYVVNYTDAMVRDNTVTSGPNAGIFYTGINFSSQGMIIRNVVTVENSGLFVGSSAEALVANNFISVEDIGTGGVYLVSLAEVDFHHNTVWGFAPLGGPALLVAGPGGAPDVSVRNNLLINDAGGQALNAPVTSIGDSDFNDLYTTGATLVDFNGTNYATLAAYQSGTGLDPNSVSVPVDFVDAATGDLHLAGASLSDMDLFGTSVGITEDIDGDPRSTTIPFMGADEGDSSPLAGTYSVGLVGFSDFDDPFEAIDALNARGTSDKVIFNLVAFSYTGQAEIENFTRFGAPTDSVIFRGTGVVSNATLRNNATSLGTNYILRITSVDYLAFEDINFDADGGTAPYGRALQINGDVQHVRFINNEFDGLTGETDPITSALVLISGTNSGNISFDEAEFDGGSHGLYAVPSLASGGLNDYVVTNSTFLDQEVAAVVIERCDDPVVDGNTISGLASGAEGIVLRDGTGGSVTNNVVVVSSTILDTAYGIELDDHDGTAGTPLLLANNMVTGYTASLYTTNVDHLQVFHNTLRQTTSVGIGEPATYKIIDAGSNHELTNNILISGGGIRPVLDIEDTGAITASDYNDLFTTSSVLADFAGTTYADLAAYQSGTGLDPNSVSKAVTFVDAATGDLHLDGPSDGDTDLGGTPLAVVPTDIDGENRGDPPYMGADEASGLAPPVNFDLVATNTTPLTVAPGGSIQFDYAISNNTANPATGNLWFAASPGGFDGIIVSGTLPGGQTFNGSYTQPVPGFTPPGTYTYTLNIGVFPGLIVDTETFTITVVGPMREGGAASWSVTEATPWPEFNEAVSDGPEAASEALPEAFALEAAYPNPFARQTTVGFALPEVADVRVVVYDVLGREVAVLVDESLEAGRHTASFEAAGLASGVYLVRMVAGSYAQVQRVTLAR